MANRPPEPSLGGRFRLPELDETAGAVMIKTEAPGALMDGWRAIFLRSEQAGPETAISGGFYVIRTADGRNLTQRVVRGQDGWSLLSAAGGVEENVQIEWIAPVRLVVPA